MSRAWGYSRAYSSRTDGGPQPWLVTIDLTEMAQGALLRILASGTAGLAKTVDALIGLDLDDVQVARGR